jgi:hypothetical protein
MVANSFCPGAEWTTTPMKVSTAVDRRSFVRGMLLSAASVIIGPLAGCGGSSEVDVTITPEQREKLKSVRLGDTSKYVQPKGGPRKRP